MKEAIRKLTRLMGGSRSSSSENTGSREALQTLARLEKTYREHLAGLPVNVEVLRSPDDTDDRQGFLPPPRRPAAAGAAPHAGPAGGHRTRSRRGRRRLPRAGHRGCQAPRRCRRRPAREHRAPVVHEVREFQRQGNRSPERLHGRSEPICGRPIPCWRSFPSNKRSRPAVIWSRRKKPGNCWKPSARIIPPSSSKA